QSAIAASLGGNVSLRAGVELQSTGNLTLASAWDLTNPSGWYLNNQPGVLTIRSGGTLDIRATLGLPNPAAPTGTGSQTKRFAPEAVPDAPSWSIQLVGGADTTSPDRLAVLPPPHRGTAGDV